MSSPTFPVTDRTRLERHPERGSHARDVILAILDEGLVAHVGVVEGGRPHVLPMAYARLGDTLYVHGAPHNRLLAAAALGAEMSLTVTLLDGLVLARSAYAHSMNYRSVVVYGRGREVSDDTEKRASLEALVEHVIPGRSADVRKPSAAELSGTRVIALALAETSAKVRTGPPRDVPADDASDAWAGVIPLRLAAGDPRARRARRGRVPGAVPRARLAEAGRVSAEADANAAGGELPPVTLADVEAARVRIAPHVRRTPLLHSPGLSARAGTEVWLKLETLQHTGSFKARGALNAVLSLTPQERARGLVAASAGNHALGMAHAVGALGGGTQAILFVQRNASPAKIEKLRRYPVEVRLEGATYEEAEAAAQAHAAATHAVYVPAYDDARVVAGHGTVGLEILEDLPAPDAVVVPTGGGALTAGIAVAVKALRPATRVVGVNPEASPSALLSFRAGRALDPYVHEPTRAHGLAGGFGRVPFAVARHLLDEVLLVSEEGIARALVALVENEPLLAEPSGVAGLAAVLASGAGLGPCVVVVLSGGNVDVATLREMLEEAATDWR